jgi:hypothetical protein
MTYLRGNPATDERMRRRGFEARLPTLERANDAKRKLRWGWPIVWGELSAFLLFCPTQIYAEDIGADTAWLKLSAMSATDIGRAPALVRRALNPEISADRERWATEKALDRNGKPLPGAHSYIAPTIAWAQAELPNMLVSLALSDTQCEGPNSNGAPDLVICNAVVSVKRGDEYRAEVVSICYTDAPDDAANEIAYNKEKDALLYRVILPQVDTEYCSKEFRLP